MINVLVTGGCGFIGSNLIPMLLQADARYRVINVDSLTYASEPDRLAHLLNNSRYQFIKADICDRRAVDRIFKDYSVHSVIHLAAETHVDRSIADPLRFVITNVEGTANLLDCALRNWKTEKKDQDTQQLFERHRFLHVSTDEVFGSLGDSGEFNESSCYAPNSPYAASKASSDHLVRAYSQTFGLNTVITNCSNNYGPGQHAEKLIPTVISRAFSLLPIPIYGNGLHRRSWLFVEDHCAALITLFKQGSTGESYAIGAESELTNLQVAEAICANLQEFVPPIGGREYRSLITSTADRPGHDYRYAIDSTKLRSQFGWRPIETFESGLRKTIAWYLARMRT